MKEEYVSELGQYLSDFQFPGRGQSETDVITFPGGIKLCMFLPGEKAKKNRSLMVSIIVRYFAGDKSLIEEIVANAMGDDPVAQMARNSLGQQPCVDDSGFKRKREEMALMEDDVKLVKYEIQTYSDVINHPVLDDAGKAVFKERILTLRERQKMEIDKAKKQAEIEHTKSLMEIDKAKKQAILDHAKESMELERQKRAMEREDARARKADEELHAIAMFEVEKKQNQEKIQTEAALMEMKAKRDAQEKKQDDLIPSKSFVTSLLWTRMTPDLISFSCNELLNKLKRSYPKIAVIKKDSKLFFKKEDLQAIEDVLFRDVIRQ